MSKITCAWDGTVLESSTVPCPTCGLTPATAPKKEKAAKKEVKQSKDRRSVERTEAWSDEPIGQPMIGVDPGAKYTGVVIRDGDVVLYAATLLRDEEADSPLEYARTVVDALRIVRKEYPDYPLAVEGISDPKGFNRGQRAAINPKYVMRMAAVAGAVAATFPESIIIPPGGNGTQHISQYPDSLKGRRNKDLPGFNPAAKSPRGHEQSAFDVAGKGALEFYNTSEKE